MTNTHGATITVNEHDLHFGDSCTFTHTEPANVKGKIGITLDAYQGDRYVYGGGGWPIPDPFVLKSNYWTGGAARCVATLFSVDMSTGKRRELAQTQFDVAA